MLHRQFCLPIWDTCGQGLYMYLVSFVCGHSGSILFRMFLSYICVICRCTMCWVAFLGVLWAAAFIDFSVCCRVVLLSERKGPVIICSLLPYNRKQANKLVQNGHQYVTISKHFALSILIFCEDKVVWTMLKYWLCSCKCLKQYVLVFDSSFYSKT